jgi:predicted nucleic-acid-binding protein
MIGLDTNVLLRLFVEEDDPQQSARVRALIEQAGSEQPCLVNVVVLAEFAWALGKSLRRPKQDVIKYLDAMLHSDDLQIERSAAARAALAAYRAGKADFSDYLIAAVNAELGCASTASFDREALKSKPFSPVP